MALTVANASPHSYNVMGRLKANVCRVTFDSSYPTGGEALDPRLFGFAEFLFVDPQVEADADSMGHVVQYEPVTKVLKVMVEEAAAAGGPLLEIANATNLSTLVVRVFALGF